jgi:GTP-binding protein
MYETKEKNVAPALVIKNATFITSAAKAEQFIRPDKPMIAVCGKSNVGKSSFINMLANRKQLAKTSREPGRTRLVNYFDFGDFVLADLPGYGFAKVSDAEKLKWADLLEKYLAKEQKLVHVFFLVDIRHDPTRDDEAMINYLHSYALPFTVVATKADKLSKSQIKPQISKIATKLRVGVGDITASSSEKGIGKAEIFTLISKAISVENK